MKMASPLLVLHALERRPHRLVIWLSLLAVCVLALLDYLTGWELSFSVFYLLPIAASSWCVGRAGGLLVACLSVALGFGVDALAGGFYSSVWVHVWNVSVRLGVFAIVAITLTTLRSALAHATEQASVDSLTGIANTRKFYSQLEHQLGLTARYGVPFTLAYIDLDNFKTLNDMLGHQAGDAALKAVADALTASLRRTDLVGRLGGDEFAVILPRTNADEARRALAHAKADVLHQIRTHDWPIGVSVGAVALAADSPSPEEMVHAADELMYRVKRSGKNDILVEAYGTRTLV